jgi:hypothetical protein
MVHVLSHLLTRCGTLGCQGGPGPRAGLAPAFNSKAFKLNLAVHAHGRAYP